MYLLFRAAFDIHPIHVLHVRGRPAFLASELGAAAGHCEDGATFLDLVTGDLAPSLDEDDDVAQLTAIELAALRREVPVVGDSVLVLFRSGAEKALARSGARHANAVLAFLRRQVFPRVGQAQCPEGQGESQPFAANAPMVGEDAPPSLRTTLVVVSGRSLTPQERQTAYDAICDLSDRLAGVHEIGDALWAALQIEAVETLLGRPLRTDLSHIVGEVPADPGPAAA